MASEVFVAVGANLGNPQEKIQQAIEQIRRLPIVRFRLSRLYRTEPVSSIPQPAFLNAVCAFDTLIQPKELLQALQQIEQSLGKQPKPKNAPRPIDLDLLFYGQAVSKDPQLTLPHPRWHERLFVLKPLSDLTDTIEIVTDHGHKKRLIIHELMQAAPKHNIEVII